MMVTSRFFVGNHLFDIALAEPFKREEMLPSYRPFLTKQEGIPVFTLVADNSVALEAEGQEIGQFDCGGNNFGVYLLPQGGYHIKIHSGESELCAMMQVQDGFRQCVVHIVTPERSLMAFGLNNAIMLAYAFATASAQTLLVHASVIRHAGLGYLFLGRSGTGKSTHSRLWLEHIAGSELMNDDNPVVRVQDGQVWVFGSPWSGKTPCYKNISAPVGGWLQLRQAKQNVIHRQTVVESLASLLPSISTMKWDKPMYANHCDTIGRIIRLCRLYHLDCLPDRDAALVSHGCMTAQ